MKEASGSQQLKKKKISDAASELSSYLAENSEVNLLSNL
jgi:hypothetical protein